MMMSLLAVQLKQKQQQQQQQVVKKLEEEEEEETPRRLPEIDKANDMKNTTPTVPTAVAAAVLGDDDGDDLSHTAAAAAAAAATTPVFLRRCHTTGEDDFDVTSSPLSPEQLFDSSALSSSPRPRISSARRGLIRRFSVERSTEDLFCITTNDDNHNFASDDAASQQQQQHYFYGAYGHLRRQLDYKYHKHYQKERQWLHDSIIEDFLGCTNHYQQMNIQQQQDLDQVEPTLSTSNGLSTSLPSSSASLSSISSSCGGGSGSEQQDKLHEQHQQQQQQFLIFTVGVKGAGKHHTIRTLIQSGRIPYTEDDVLFVDADEIRRLLPEYDSYSPHRVGPLTQKEANYIAETMVLAGLMQSTGTTTSSGTSARRRRKNIIIWDVTLESATWFVQFITSLRLQYPTLKVAILQVTADLDQILQRIHDCSFYTKRQISRRYVEETIHQIPYSVKIVAPITDYSNIILCNNNDPSPLELIQGDWDEMQSFFSNKTPSISSSTLTLRQQQQHQPDTSTKKNRGRRHSTAMMRPRGGEEPDAVDNDDKKLLRFGGLGRRHQSLQLHYNSSSLNSLHRGHHRRRFSVLQSTEHNHATTSTKCYGPFAHIRANMLDYTYHSNYTFERQHFQDAIISHFLEAAVIRDRNGILCSTPMEPWLVFTAGAMGAGKSYTMNKLVHQGRFPLLHFVVVDPDEIRRHLPEYHLYLEHSPEMAGELTRKEAGYIAEILTLASLLAGKNTLVDGSLRDADWYCEYIQQLRREFPILRLAILHVTAPRAAVFRRAAQRAITTGRLVPRDLLIKALEQVPKSVEKLSPLVDYTAELHNAPHSDDIELVAPKGETWDSFKEQWSQTCAWEPKRIIAQTKLVSATKTPSSERLAAQLIDAVAR